MRAATLFAVLLAAAGAALATGSTSQSGECGYTGDWRQQALPGISSGGPPAHAYASVGACASAFADALGDGRVRVVVRADVLDAPAAYVLRYEFLGATGEIACGGGFCELGPLEGTIRPGPGCGLVEVRRDGALLERASACA